MHMTWLKSMAMFNVQVISHCIDARPCNDFVVLRRIRNCLCIIIIIIIINGQNV